MPAPAFRSSMVSNSGTTSTSLRPTSLSSTIGSRMSETVPVIEIMQCDTDSGPKSRTARAAARKIPSSFAVSSLNSFSVPGKSSGRLVCSSRTSTATFSSSPSARYSGVMVAAAKISVRTFSKDSEFWRMSSVERWNPNVVTAERSRANRSSAMMSSLNWRSERSITSRSRLSSSGDAYALGDVSPSNLASTFFRMPKMARR